MPGFRVSKYSPTSDASAQHEWTSVSDIGKVYAGSALSLLHYLRAEDSYVECVRRFLGAVFAASLRVSDLEQRRSYSQLPPSLLEESRAHCFALSEGAELSGDDLDWAVRLNLREVTWCRLSGHRGCYVHFGYDYYMYMGCEIDGFELPRLPEGMFAEPFVSPYHPE